MTANPDWTPLLLRTNGVELFAFECDGAADLAPVVLLHGAGGNALTWMTLASAFNGRRTLLVDMPAHGRSPKLAGWNLEETADAVARAVQHWLGDAAGIWGGHSWGGKVVGLVAARHPSLCRGLVLLDPSPSSAVPIPIEDFVDGTWTAELQSYATAQEACDAARSQRHWQPWTQETEAAQRHGLAQRADSSWSLAPSREDLIDLATATLHCDASEALASASAIATLLVIADESSAWQAVTNMLVYGAATQIVIPGNHWIHQCNPEAVSTAVQTWLDRNRL